MQMPEPAEMQIGDPEWNRMIVTGAETLGVRVSAAQVAQFEAHIRELLLWNRKTNVTAITQPFEVAIKHVVDSLAIARWIHPEASVLDVGSGGGFPGIPLKILMPSLSVTLIDSSRKKISFQRHVIRTLGLVNIDAVQTRIEALSADPGHLQGGSPNAFSVIVCRAFTDLARFVEMAMPLLAPAGMIIAMKGRISREEQADVSSLISRMAQAGTVLHSRTISYNLPFLGAERCLYIVTANIR
jgi:16S rRNA (guanine527-N7)-methyltransferase